MREIKDFDTEKKIFIGKVLNHIHYKKLHTRIYDELSSHMDDMYEYFSSTCDDEKEVTKRVINEMGNPEKLGYELKNANKEKLLQIKIIRTICILLCLPVLYSVWVMIIHIGMEFEDYYYADTAEEAEEWILENRTDGQPIELLTELEHDGVVHRIYVPQAQNEDDFQIYHIYSMEFFGFNIKNRFNRSHCHCEPDGNYTMASLDQRPIRDELMIYYNTPDYRYIKVEFIPTEDGLEEYWSDFIEIPQDATIDEPKYFILDCPDGYRWSNYERFDENKDIYIPEPTTNITDCDSNRIKVHSSTVIH